VPEEIDGETLIEAPKTNVAPLTLEGAPAEDKAANTSLHADVDPTDVLPF
jgi:hypothetical protein